MTEDSEASFGVPKLLSEISERIRLAVTTGGGDAEVSKASGVKLRTLQNYKSGVSKPSADAAGAIARATGVSLDWLINCEGPMVRRPVSQGRQVQDVAELRQHIRAIEEGEGNAVGPDKGFVMIPRYDVQASAGPGMFADQEQILDYMAFQRGWVRRVLRANPDDLVLISAEGDSMEPAVRSGDLLLVDTAVTAFRDDAIYVVVLAGRLLVKRVQNFFDGAVTIKSDNAAYVEQTIGAGEVDQIQVAGRVRWIGRLI